MTDHVVLVNTDDVPQGTAEKLEAHVHGWLHRAFSIFVFDSRGRLLLQKRADDKYHSAGLWSNTCCSHPRPDEDLEEAVQRRLVEEMGFDCDVHHAFQFVYRADVGEGLVEHELDHVFIGHADPTVNANSDEVSDWAWVTPEDLLADVAARPERYTFWFRHILDRTLAHVSARAA
ncbi:isopentenyl-diphosphate delta-isomerase [Longibacter salinarum]|uniref:Isopentenyl-diphosphate delta-isomerase n=1 Tax=Longibacter salinarum TaxID=1850348 RepID=A0A2A8CYZ2_9BACT|nr:isopentenyl-diphosphate Delta-isomerase [Longibacter salinarum]PEN13844.1 isopentenyl-diphosphate delta-isomerase [Longibacter salinarum]